MDRETYGMLVDAARVQLTNVRELDAGSKEGKEALAKSVHLVELLNEADKITDEYYDKEERRKIEKERNEAMNETERDKQKITWGRACLEMAKVIGPLMVSVIAYNVFQKRVLKFEETGRISSTAGRELHLPKFLK